MSLLPAFLTDNLDEVVFEGRNQAYGAYQLRQDYRRHLSSAGGITLGLCVLLLLGWAAWRNLMPVARPTDMTQHIADIVPFIVPTIEHPKVAVLPPRVRAIPTHPKAPTPPTQVGKDDMAPPRPTPPLLTEVVDGPAGPPAPGVSMPDAGSALDAPAVAATDATDAVKTSSEPFVYVEKMPEFVGGQAALLRYLQSHLRYPSSALAAGVGGRVIMSFVVQADGKISDITILKGLGYGLDEEAERVVRQMPTWTPGYQSKHAVPVQFTLPITFQFQ